jgi:hypothetical protein
MLDVLSTTPIISFLDFPSVISLASTSHEIKKIIDDGNWFNRQRKLWTNVLINKWNWKQHSGYFRQPHIFATHHEYIHSSLQTSIIHPTPEEIIHLEFSILRLQYMSSSLSSSSSNTDELLIPKQSFIFRIDDEIILKEIKYITSITFNNQSIIGSAADFTIDSIDYCQLTSSTSLELIASLTHINTRTFTANLFWSHQFPFPLATINKMPLLIRININVPRNVNQLDKINVQMCGL